MSQLHVDIESIGMTVDVEMDLCSRLDDAISCTFAPAMVSVAMTYALAALMCDEEWTKMAITMLAQLTQQFRDAVISTPTIQ